MRKIKIQSILAAVAGLFLATSCSSSFLDTDPTDAVSSDKVSVPENAEALVNGAWYNLFDYSSTYANIGYRSPGARSSARWSSLWCCLPP